MKKIVLLILAGVMFLITLFMMSTRVYAETSLYEGLVELGSNHTIAVTREGKLYVFGRNLWGQLGDGSGESQWSPVDLTPHFTLNPDEKIIDVAAGSWSSGMLTNQNRVFTWGDNGDGQLGDGTFDSSDVPVEITDNFPLEVGEDIIELDMGEFYSAAVTSEGRLFTWGYNSNYQLGFGEGPSLNVPTDVTPALNLHENETIIDVDLGYSHTLVITSEYRVLTWGDNDYGECGIDASFREAIPIDVTPKLGLSGDEHVAYISAGEGVSFVVTNQSRVFSFGLNDNGQLGDGTTVSPVGPIEVTSSFSLADSETVISIGAGSTFTTFVTSEGRLFAWGSGYYSAIGVEGWTGLEVPTDITYRVTLDTNEKVVYVVSSYYFSALVTSTGDVHMWGKGDKGQLGLGTDVEGTDIPTFNGVNLSEPDVIPPTCDITPDQTIEAGEYTDIDWTTYITGAVDETGREVAITEQSDPVLYDTVGTYSVSVDLSDPDNNTHTETFNVTVVDTSPPTFDTILDQLVQIDSDPIDWTTYITNPSDNASGVLTPEVVTNTIDYTTPGIYSVTVKLTDESLNETQQTFHVQVVVGTRVPKYRTIIHDPGGGPYHYYETFGALKVAVGLGHTMVLTTAGEVFTWGFNESGQLGDGTQTDSLYEINITDSFNLATDDAIIDIQAAFQQSMALSKNGRLFYWGNNDQPLYNTDNNITTPFDITHKFSLLEDEQIISFQMDTDYVLVVTSLNRIFMYGKWDQSIIDDLVVELNQKNDSIEQIKIANLGGIIVTELGSVYTWGWNGYAQLGDGSTVEWSDGAVNITEYIVLHPDETIEQVFYTTLSVEVITSEHRVLHWGFYNMDDPSSATGRYETKEILDITDDFHFEEGEYVVSVYGGVYSAIFVTSLNRVFSMCNFIEDGEVVGGGDYVIDQTEVVNPNRLEILDFDVQVHSYNWAWVLSDGTLHTFGDNTYNQLGIAGDSTTPVEVDKAYNEFTIDPLPYWDFVNVSTSGTHTLALTSQGEVFAWGDNTYGQLATGDTVSISSLARVTDNLGLHEGEKILNMYAGVGYSFFITTEHRILAIGRNDQGQLGISNFVNQTSVVDITNRFVFLANEHIAKLSLYGGHNLMLTTEGRLFSWGANSNGQVGNGSLSNIPTPQDITFRMKSTQDEYVVDIAAGTYHSLAITSLGRVFAWGKNTFGELGTGSISDYNTYPTDITANFQLSTDDRITQVAAGAWHSYALSESGIFYSWGRNEYGQLGNNSTSDQSSPAPINAYFTLQDGDTIKQIYSGANSGFIFTELGSILAFGDNYYELFGFTSPTMYEQIPVDITSIISSVTGNSVIIDLDLKGFTSFFISEDHRLYSAGLNTLGQLGLNDTSNHDTINEIFYDLSGDIDIWYIDVNQETLVYDEYITLRIYPNENWGVFIDEIDINETLYSNFVLDNGVIEIQLENTYNIDDFVEFNVTGGTMFNGQTFKFDLNNYNATTIIEDHIPPEFTLEDQTINIDDLVTASTLVIHYNRPDGNYDGWNLWLWGDQCDNTDPKCGEGFEFNGTDDFGVVLTLDLATTYSDLDTYSSIGFVVRLSDDTNEWIEKDYEQDRYIDLSIVNANGEVHVFVDSGVAEIEMGEDITQMDWSSYVTSVTDNSNGAVTFSVVSSDIENYKIPGTYEVIIQAEDESGNTSQKSINITLVDTTPPTVNHDPNMFETIMAGEYTNRDWTILITDYSDNSASPLVVVEEDSVDYDTPGTYEVKLYVVDSSGNKSIVITLTVTVTEDKRPKVTLNPGIDTFYVDGVWTDPGVTITNSEGTTLTVTGIIDLDEDTPGTYPVIYTVSKEGLDDIVVIRYVTVLPIEVTPNVVFTLNETISTITVGQEYIDTGCTASDNTNTYQCLVQSNNVNIYVQGTYQIVYYITIDNVVYTKTRYVFVVSDMVIPTLYFIKEEEVTIQ